MALKNHEVTVQADISYFMNVTADRGCVVVVDTSTTGVGSALDDANAKVKLPANASGIGEGPVGILMHDVVNKDLTETHTNQHKREVNVGGKVTVMVQGEVETDRIAPDQTPQPGQLAIFDATGVLRAVSEAPDLGVPVIGRFLSGKDSDGYAKVRVNVI